MGVLATDILPNLDLAKLIEELAADLRPATDVWSDYGIYSRAQAETLLGLPVVQEMYLEARNRWHSKTNVRERIKSKSLVAIEHSLPDLVVEAGETTKPLNHRMEIWKLIAKLAGIDAENNAAAGLPGGGVNITIDLSGGIGELVGGGQVISITGSQRNGSGEESIDEHDGTLPEDEDPDDLPFSIEVDVDEEIAALGRGLEEETDDVD